MFRYIFVSEIPDLHNPENIGKKPTKFKLIESENLDYIFKLSLGQHEIANYNLNFNQIETKDSYMNFLQS